MFEIVARTVEEAKEHFASFGEVAIDLAADSEAWENIPLVDYATKILSIKDIYSKNKLKRNYAQFVKAVSALDRDEALKLLEKMQEDRELTEETAEVIFDVITSSNAVVKPQLLGNLLVALARGQITLYDFNTLALIIDSGSIAALRAIPNFLARNERKYTTTKFIVPSEALLMSLGIAQRHGNRFWLDHNGVLLAQYGFGIQVDT